MQPPLAPFCGRLLDCPVIVRASEPDAAAAVRSVLQGFATGAAPTGALAYVVRRDERDRWHVETGGESVCEARALADALLALEWRLVTDMLARHPAHFHLHGAALAAPSGSTSLLVPGASGTGKTTLTLGLMARGFLPFSDDVVLLDPRRLEPVTFRRAFHVDPATRALVERDATRAPCRFEGLPAGYGMPFRWAELRAPVRTVFFPTLRPGDAPAVTKLSAAEAATALLRLSSTLEHAPGLALAVAARLTAHAASYALSAGDLEATAELVAEVTERDARRPTAGAPG